MRTASVGTNALVRPLASRFSQRRTDTARHLLSFARNRLTWVMEADALSAVAFIWTGTVEVENRLEADVQAIARAYRSM